MSKRRRKSVYIQPPHEVNSKRERATTTKNVRSKPAARSRAMQDLPPPSIRRTAKMLPIYFVVMFALQYVLTSGGSMNTQERLANALIIATMISIVFFPVLHMMEKSRYKRIQKMNARAKDGTSGKASDLPKKNGRAVKG